MGHKEEFEQHGTIGAWTEEEANERGDWSTILKFKDAHGKASLKEQVAIRIENLLLYNNVDHISEEEIMEAAQDIVYNISCNKS